MAVDLVAGDREYPEDPYRYLVAQANQVPFTNISRRHRLLIAQLADALTDCLDHIDSLRDPS